MSPVEVAILVDAGRKIIRVIHMPQTAGDAEAEVVIGNGFVAQQATKAHVGMLPSALQVTGV
jgi:hypothetical protein